MLKIDLKIPDYDEKQLYTDSIKGKSKSNQRILNGLKPEIFKRYKEYSEKKNELENIFSSNDVCLNHNQTQLIITCLKTYFHNSQYFP